MVVMEGPEPGYETDIMVWRDCQIRHDIEEIIKSRLVEISPRRRLKLYMRIIYIILAP
jgi:hypothetical protein